MTWFGWFLAVDIGLSALVKIAQVGKRRDIVTSSYAIWSVIFAVFYIAGMATIGTVR